jgi:REP element-mobilizing transposase RayT
MNQTDSTDALATGQHAPATRCVPFVGLDSRKRVVVTEQTLPHWLQDGASYFVTYRLADSVPAPLLKQWRIEREAWLAHRPQPWSDADHGEYESRFTRRMEDWLDAGTGSCVLRQPRVRSEAVRAVTIFDDRRHDLDCAVVMPNHVHLILKPRSGQDLFRLLGGMKAASARACNSLLGRTGAFWMEDIYNRLVRDGEELWAYRHYIAHNGRNAGLREDEFTLIENHVLK